MIFNPDPPKGICVFEELNGVEGKWVKKNGRLCILRIMCEFEFVVCLCVCMRDRARAREDKREEGEKRRDKERQEKANRMKKS